MPNHKILETTITRRTYPGRKPWYQSTIAGTPIELHHETSEAALTATKEYVLSALRNIEELPTVIPVPSYDGRMIVVFPLHGGWAYAFFKPDTPASPANWSGLCLSGDTKEETIAAAIRHARQIEELPEGDS